MLEDGVRKVEPDNVANKVETEARGAVLSAVGIVAHEIEGDVLIAEVSFHCNSLRICFQVAEKALCGRLPGEGQEAISNAVPRGQEANRTQQLRYSLYRHTTEDRPVIVRGLLERMQERLHCAPRVLSALLIAELVHGIYQVDEVAAYA